MLIVQLQYLLTLENILNFFTKQTKNSLRKKSKLQKKNRDRRTQKKIKKCSICYSSQIKIKITIA